MSCSGISSCHLTMPSWLVAPSPTCLLIPDVSQTRRWRTPSKASSMVVAKPRSCCVNNNGRPFIHSFAHGGASYELRLDDTPEGVSLDDFWAYMRMHNYIYAPTR